MSMMNKPSTENDIYPRSVQNMEQILFQANEEGRLAEVVVREVSKNVSMPALWSCKKYLTALPEQIYYGDTSEAMTLISVRALIESLDDNLEGAKKYVALMGETPKYINPDTLTRRDWFRMVTELVMPYISDDQFFRIVHCLQMINMTPVNSLTLSAGRPSILNGFRDFTRYGRYLERYADRIQQSIHVLYGDRAKGVYKIALAEWYYQNNDSFHALVLVAGTIPFMEDKQDVQCLFVAMALQMRILLLNGQTQVAEPLVNKIRKKVIQERQEELMGSLDALGAWGACYDGKLEIVKDWLETKAPDENKDMFMMDVYAYLVKIKAYLYTGKNMKALVLAKKLGGILKKGKRYMDICECHMLAAMACYKAESYIDMCDELEVAFGMAKRYGYIRLLADEGICMVNMIRIYRERRGADAFIDSILPLAQEVAARLPDYLKTPAEDCEPLTKTEKQVLYLMVQGMSYDEICKSLEKKLPTVKFHASGIYRKLKVKNRQQAIKKAREIGLI